MIHVHVRHAAGNGGGSFCFQDLRIASCIMANMVSSVYVFSRTIICMRPTPERDERGEGAKKRRNQLEQGTVSAVRRDQPRRNRNSSSSLCVYLSLFLGSRLTWNIRSALAAMADRLKYAFPIVTSDSK